MNAKACAPSNKALDWKTIDWKKAEAYVKKLQMRIVKAHNNTAKHALQFTKWSFLYDVNDR